MYYEKDAGKKIDEALKVSISKAAQVIDASGKSIQTDADKIIQSFFIPGSKGADRKKLLTNKANNLKNLAALHRQAAINLRSSVVKLGKGIPVDKVMSEILGFMVFFSDQIKCEEVDSQRTLSILRGSN